MQVNVIVWVKNGGWIRDEFHGDGMITGLKFTQERARAKRYDESGAELEAVRRYVEGMGCHYDMERDYFGEGRRMSGNERKLMVRRMVIEMLQGVDE